MKIKTKEDCRRVLQQAEERGIEITLIPETYSGNYRGSHLKVVFASPKKWVELWHGEDKPFTSKGAVDGLWEYRKAFNDSEYTEWKLY